MVDLINSELFFGSEELDNEFREKCIVQIKLAVQGLNEIGIECSFDESTLKIK